MRPPRGLSTEEAALWRKVASTVTPIGGKLLPPPPKEAAARSAEGGGMLQAQKPEASRPAKSPPPALRGGPSAPRGEDGRAIDRQGLDGGWERKLSRGSLDPDFTLDLHGATLDGAHARLTMGLSQARAMNARVVLLITGRPRPVEAADRGHARGAIRAKVVDWLAAGEHAGSIAAIRGAHRRHGGAGALYLVLRKRR